jgi:hypothetical protein
VALDLIVKLATAIAQKAASDATAPLVRDLAGLQDAQIERLKAIRQDVKALVGAPAREARVHLNEASQAPNDARRSHYLNLAQEKLVQAYGNEPTPTTARAAVEAELALVFRLLGEPDAAARWAFSAWEDQRAAMAAAAPRVERKLNFPLGFVYESSDFWRYIKQARAAAPDIADKALSRWPESVDRRVGSHSAFWSNVATAISLGKGGRELADLREMDRDARSYCWTAWRMDAKDVRQYSLVVDLSRNRSAKITWEPFG